MNTARNENVESVMSKTAAEKGITPSEISIGANSYIVKHIICMRKNNEEFWDKNKITNLRIMEMAA